TSHAGLFDAARSGELLAHAGRDRARPTALDIRPALPARHREKHLCSAAAADDDFVHVGLGAPVHYCITSSARPRSDGGIVRPSALAVLRLMTNSNFVGACNGRLAGFSPLRMRSMYPAARRNCSLRTSP